MSCCPEFEQATYVEGIVNFGVPLEHGWIQFEGEIIDPTLPTGNMICFPGLRFEGMYGISKALQIPKHKGQADFPNFFRFGGP